MKIIIFGAGRIGQTVCLDLSAQSGLDLTIVDKSEKAVASLPGNLNVNSMVADVSEKESIFKLLQGQDLVVNALPGRLGFRLMSCAIEAGLNLVDVSFFGVLDSGGSSPPNWECPARQEAFAHHQSEKLLKFNSGENQDI
ncbi:MAG: hypothetical protein DRJ06_05870, partial [Candidatus Aminicenantes bacterium]